MQVPILLQSSMLVFCFWVVLLLLPLLETTTAASSSARVAVNSSDTTSWFQIRRGSNSRSSSNTGHQGDGTGTGTGGNSQHHHRRHHVDVPIEPQNQEAATTVTVTTEALVGRALQTPYYSYYYYETSSSSSLGEINVDVTVGNPMKGLCSNPGKTRSYWPTDDVLPSSLHLIKRGMDEIMINNPDVVGTELAFNWTILDQVLEEAEYYRSHAIIRFYIHWPSPDKPLNIPQYLSQEPYKVFRLKHEGEVMPWYGDINLRKAIQQFIYEFGRRYDGDYRIFAVQAGLLGAWGEWHTQGCTYRTEDCCPLYVEQEVIQWYGEAFSKTHVQFRRPERVEAYNLGFGFHDDSFTYITLGGEDNGGLDKNNIFWTAATKYGTTNFWKRAPMGGELRPDNADAFTNDFPAGTEYHQDFNLCVNTTHTTYMAWRRGFSNGGITTGPELDNALYAWARMGYNFIIDRVSVAESIPTIGTVNIDVTIRQIGIAPFYYPLWLNLFCDGVLKGTSLALTVDLSETGSTVVASLMGIPATSSCLSSVELQLGSNYLYPDRPIKWAQGTDGRVILNIPLPGVVGTTPVATTLVSTSPAQPAPSSSVIVPPTTLAAPTISLSRENPWTTSNGRCNCSWIHFWRCIVGCAF